MEPVRIRLLGSFWLARGKQEITLPTQKTKELLAYLVLHRGRLHPREQLAELFWGDLGRQKAYNNLRRALGERYLISHRDEVGFNAAVTSGHAAPPILLLKLGIIDFSHSYPLELDYTMETLEKQYWLLKPPPAPRHFKNLPSLKISLFPRRFL